MAKSSIKLMIRVIQESVGDAVVSNVAVPKLGIAALSPFKSFPG